MRAHDGVPPDFLLWPLHVGEANGAGPAAGADRQAPYVDMDGRPVTLVEWLRLMADPASRWKLVHDVTATVRIVTTWFGTVRTPGVEDRPFQTAAFVGEAPTYGGRRIHVLNDYANKADAVAGHARLCRAAHRGDRALLLRLAMPADADPELES